MMALPFYDRADAGRQLARNLRHYEGERGVIVLALPRGGVPVGYEVAQALHLPLDVFLVRKLGVPGHEELAMGAIASGGVQVMNEDVVLHLHIPQRAIDAAAEKERGELERRELEYREGRPAPEIRGAIVILIDDGLATGSTMLAAVKALRRERAKRVVVAVPVAAPATCLQFRDIADEVVCAEMPENFQAVGEWYYDFSQTTGREVRELLARAGSRRPVEPAGHP
jgi:putative phosphoribosyl transferase